MKAFRGENYNKDSLETNIDLDKVFLTENTKDSDRRPEDVFIEDLKENIKFL